jgi:ribose transport system substrate-binding protein
MRLLSYRRLVMLGAAVTVAAVAGYGASAGTASNDRATAKIRIGYVLPDLANPFIAALRDGAAAEAKKQGVDLLVKGTNDPAGQTNAFLNYVGAKVDAIGVDSIDSNAIVPAVQKANAANIPVIAIQAQPKSGKVATFIAADNFKGGVLIGQAISEYCKGKNPCKVGIVQGILADQSGADEDLNYIYSWWDQGALSALEAARAKGKAGKIGISGFGGNCLNLAEVIKGNIYQETVFFPEQMGAMMVKSALASLKGQKLPARTPAPILKVTTKYANDLLSGKVKAPAGLPIVDKLKKAKSGGCPK